MAAARAAVARLLVGEAVAVTREGGRPEAMRCWLITCALLTPAGCASHSTCAETVPPAAEPAAGPAPAPADASADTPTDAPADPTVEPTLILLVRHAEKAATPPDDPPLTDRGTQRAQCLARTLAPLGVTALYATQLRRTQDTLAPLSDATGHPVTVIPAQDSATWAETLAALDPGARVVVAGHSNTLPALVGSLGGRLDGLDAQGNIPDADYDRLVHVIRRGDAPAVVFTTAYCLAD